MHLNALNCIYSVIFCIFYYYYFYSSLFDCHILLYFLVILCFKILSYVYEKKKKKINLLLNL